MSAIGLAMGMIGCAVALFVGVMIFSSISESIDCNDLTSNVTQAKCNEVKDISWTVIGLVPLALFFVLFLLFGSLSGEREETSHTKTITSSGKSALVFLEDTFISFLIIIGLAKVDKGN